MPIIAARRYTEGKPEPVEDALNPRQLPKVDIFAQQLFVVARTAMMAADDSIT